MASSLEFEGRNVEIAVEKASKDLGIPIETLRYDVISYGSTGIFGLVGTKKAKIRAILPKDDKAFDGVSNKQPADTAENLSSTNHKPVSKTKDTSPDVRLHDFSVDLVKIGTNALQRIIDLITTDASISVEEGSERIIFNVEGGNTPVLIGKRGQTLEAIQYLVEKIVNKRSGQRIRIQVDVGGYLKAKEAKLKELAERLAKKAKYTGKPETMGKMNAYDRRIVHLALKDDRNVRTMSVGKDFYRKLVIFPKNKKYSEKRIRLSSLS